MVWAFAERISAQLVTLLVSVVLARKLGPDEYATVAIVMIFVTIANVFVTSGFGSPLVQKLHADDLDFSTTFWFSLGISSALYITLFFLAPVISVYYDMPILTSVIRVMSVRLVIAAINSIQQAYVSRKMAFRKFFFSTLSGSIVSGLVGIGMVYANLGLWSIVGQYLSNAIVNTIFLAFTCGWSPKWEFSVRRMKGLFSYGWKVLVSDFVSTVYEQIRGLILSKHISPTELSLYNQGEKFPSLFVDNIETSIHKVLMPVVAKEQEDKDRVLFLTRKSMRISSFIIWPLLLGLVIVAPLLIEILYTKKWLGSVPYLQLISMTYLMKPVVETHTRTMKALGRSDLLARMSMARYIVGVVLLVLAIAHSHNAMLIVGSWTVSMIIAILLCGYINSKLIGYAFKMQWSDLIKPLISSVIMCIMIYPIAWVGLPRLVNLMMQILVGFSVYLGISYVINRQEFIFIVKLIKSYLPRTKNNLASGESK